MNEPKKKSVFGRLFGLRREEEEDDRAPEDEVPVAEAEAPTREADETAQPLAELAEPAVPQPESLDERADAPEPAPAAQRGWFQRLRDGLSRTSSRLSDGITGIFTKRRLDDDTLEELEDILIQADLGLDVASRITDNLRRTRYNSDISPDEVRAVLAQEVEKVLEPLAEPLMIDPSRRPHVILVVGVNGTGKTTTIGKYARQFRSEGRSVMLAAGDTFRAAAIEQLKIWGERTGSAVIAKTTGADASGLAFEAMTAAKEQGFDVLLIDTAGRLQNKAALMAELEKIVRVIRKVDPTAPHDVILTLDATTGQNALSQVEVFERTAGVTGIVMTKLDGTARGGILVAIASKYGLPIHAAGVGEGPDDLQAFNARDFSRAIAGSA